MTRIFFAELTQSGAVELVSPGDVEAMLDTLKVRSSEALTSAQVLALGDSLRVRYLIVGSLLESSRVRTADGEAPTIGATARLIEAKTGRVVWAGVRFRTGDDRETVFGFGRVSSADQLAAQLARELFAEFHEVGRATASKAKRAGEKP